METQKTQLSVASTFCLLRPRAAHTFGQTNIKVVYKASDNNQHRIKRFVKESCFMWLCRIFEMAMQTILTLVMYREEGRKLSLDAAIFVYTRGRQSVYLNTIYTANRYCQRAIIAE
jgi:hypothetical protein